jgi:para-aminobenzoate synthetase/4-amino-4-deoxychorismate lyase
MTRQIPPLSEPELYSLLDRLTAEDGFVFLETTKIDRENYRSYVFCRPVAHLVCRADDDPFQFLAQAQQWLRSGYYLAGWLGYELGYLLEPALTAGYRAGLQDRSDTMLAELLVCKEPHILDHRSGAFAGAGPWPGAGESPKSDHPEHYSIGNLRLTMEEEAYLEAFTRIKSYITGGDTYQVNFTLKYSFDFSGSVPAFYTTLRRNQSVSYSAWIKSGARQILSFSPELFFRKQAAEIIVRPMKGTLHRGRTLSEDRRLVEFLRHDIKTRSENVMIVDLLRNDLGRLPLLQVPNGVEVQSLFDIETFETLHQMTSTVRGNITPDGTAQLTVTDLLKALFPCGSVTGAPKIRTMEIIRELECEERGVYTGAIGFFAPDGDAVFNVPIRTVVLDGDRGEMGIGSGIVSDSDGQKEWEECTLKARFLTRPSREFQLIETILWRPEIGFWLLDLHLDRLEQSARYFLFFMERQAIAAQLLQFSSSFTDIGCPRRVRLTLDRAGSIQITETPLTTADIVGVVRLDAGNDQVGAATGAAAGSLPKVMFSEQRTDSANPHYYHKTTCRELYDEERKKAVQKGFFEVLFCNEKGEVTEGSMSNIFIKKGDTLFTPPVTCGLLDGILRRHLMAAGALPVREKILTPQDVRTADVLYVANSVRGLVEVTFG